MAEYRVFNPDNGVGMNTDAPLDQLPPGLQGQLWPELVKAQPRYLRDREKEEGAELLMARGAVADLEGFGFDIGPIMDKWAIAVTFDPERVVVREAAWVLSNNVEPQRVETCRLVDDPQSPNGFSWHIATWGLDKGAAEWNLVADELLVTGHGLANAQELGPAFGSNPAIYDRFRITRVPMEFCREELGLWSDAPGSGREAALGEIAGFKDRDWFDVDAPEFPTFDRLEREEISEVHGTYHKKFGQFDVKAPYHVNQDGTCNMYIDVVNSENHRVVGTTTGYKSGSFEHAYNMARNECLGPGMPWKGDPMDPSTPPPQAAEMNPRRHIPVPGKSPGAPSIPKGPAFDADVKRAQQAAKASPQRLPQNPGLNQKR